MSFMSLRIPGRFRFVFSLFVIIAVGSATAGLSATPKLQPLEIATKSGVHVFMVELAENDEQRARGLMFRKELPEGQGMLFDFKRDMEISMWMENTYVSLDMIFVLADGRILRVAENTQPLSRATVSSGGPVRAVLEVLAGTTRKLGIAPGDTIAHPMFKVR